MNVRFLSELLGDIAERGRRIIGGERDVGADPSDIVATCKALLSSRGEASGVALAQEILAAYTTLDDTGRAVVFRALADEFGPDLDALRTASAAFLDASDTNATDGHRSAAARELLAAAEPSRHELVRRLNLAPGGTATLVRMRADLLRAAREDPSLDAVDADFRTLFTSWFNRGFLVLQRIDWNTPAAILERIIAYEAVHEIRDWDDLRSRIEPEDRRLFAFFHPALVDDPLIFVEVALMSDRPDAIAPILQIDRTVLPAREATTAVFYSISNCQRGLAGISFGHFLIKQVVEELAREIPALKTFVTLSPVPGFRQWLEQSGETGRSVLDEFDSLAPGDNQVSRTVGRELAALASHYLQREKAANGRPDDPVARFHLGNGARLERINPMADLSAAGRARSAGVMVNYLYDLKDIEKNHEAYANDGAVIASAAVRRLLTTAAARTRTVSATS